MNFINALISDYGLLAMFFLILIEYACFPISSEIVLPFSGALASYQHIPFLLLLGVSIAAGLIGTSFCFFIGRFGGNYIITLFLKHFPKQEKSFQSSYSLFQTYGSFATCFGRLIPICRTYIAFIAGTYKQPFPLFLLSSSIGISVWNCILIGIGYYFRENWSIVKVYYEDYKLFFIILLIACIAFYFIHKHKHTNK